MDDWAFLKLQSHVAQLLSDHVEIMNNYPFDVLVEDLRRNELMNFKTFSKFTKKKCATYGYTQSFWAISSYRALLAPVIKTEQISNIFTKQNFKLILSRIKAHFIIGISIAIFKTQNSAKNGKKFSWQIKLNICDSQLKFSIF